MEKRALRFYSERVTVMNVSSSGLFPPFSQILDLIQRIRTTLQKDWNRPITAAVPQAWEESGLFMFLFAWTVMSAKEHLWERHFGHGERQTTATMNVKIETKWASRTCSVWQCIPIFSVTHLRFTANGLFCIYFYTQVLLPSFEKVIYFQNIMECWTDLENLCICVVNIGTLLNKIHGISHSSQLFGHSLLNLLKSWLFLHTVIVL